MIYNFAPTDPRYLDATDEMIIADLLERASYQAQVRGSAHPDPVSVHDADALESYQARKQAALEQPIVKAALERAQGRKREDIPPRTISLSMRGFP